MGEWNFINTVGQHGNEETISKYVKNQEVKTEYKANFIWTSAPNLSGSRKIVEN